MCRFITTAFGPGANFETLGPILARHGMAFRPVANRDVLSRLPAGTLYGTLTRGPCDCSTPLGRGTAEPAEGVDPRRLRKRQARGWRQAKIRRWVEGKIAAAARPTRTGGASAGLPDWLGVIRGCLASGGTRTFGLLSHFYSGSLDGERFSFQQVAVPAGQLSEEFLRDLSENVLYVFHPQP